VLLAPQRTGVVNAQLHLIHAWLAHDVALAAKKTVLSLQVGISSGRTLDGS
jgi:hypothetical protein